MSKYLFKDTYFGISEEGLHLLRNGFNYKTLAMAEIEAVRVGKGKSIKNWFVLLGVGIFFILGALYVSRNIWSYLAEPGPGSSIYGEEIIAAVSVAVFGVYCILRSLKTEEVIEFQHATGKEAYATKELKEMGEFDDLLAFLKQRKPIV